MKSLLNKYCLMISVGILIAGSMVKTFAIEPSNTSQAGANWKKVAIPALSGTTWSGKQFVAGGEKGMILNSLEGETWIIGSTGVSNMLA